jgi:arginine decarboxylase
MRSLDTPGIHGYQPVLGYRVYTSKALEMLAEKPAIDLVRRS